MRYFILDMYRTPLSDPGSRNSSLAVSPPSCSANLYSESSLQSRQSSSSGVS
uniref:Uncharacterized protein n=1 Tax=Plectus sambesii TaxID=2011161 RepID=A0A914XNN9_9BILA